MKGYSSVLTCLSNININININELLSVVEICAFILPSGYHCFSSTHFKMLFQESILLIFHSRKEEDEEEEITEFITDLISLIFL